MKVYFLRHGETNYNVLGLCNDDPARDVHLTERGKVQARAAAERLRDARIARVIVSELPRTRETAEIVNVHHRAPIAVHPAINDWRTGMEGKPVAVLYRAIERDPLHTRIDGGETLLEHKARVLRFLHWLERQTHATTLVVAHEETLRVASLHFRGLRDEEMRALKFGNGEGLAFEVGPH